MFRMKYFYLPMMLWAFSCMEGAGQTDVHQLAQFERYALQNQELQSSQTVKGRVVFMGNSITENWAKMRPDFFTKYNYIGRGISGQTSYQFLLRFRQDVINLHPEIVVINAATNDIAENTGKYNEDYTMGNIVSMVELAEANGIKVILTTTLPAAAFGWNPSIKDAPEKIVSLNERIRKYAEKKAIPFVDYYSSMVRTSDKALLPSYTQDGVHPTAEGYQVMEGLIKPVVDRLLK